MTATIRKSMRLPGELIKELKAITLESGKDFSTVTKELLQEAVKMRRCPGIVFTEGVRGDRARIAGTGMEVWEVIAGYKNVDEDFKRLHKTYHWLTEQQLRAAIGYHKSYPDEIDHLIIQNEGRPHHGVLIIPHTIQGDKFSIITSAIKKYTLKHPSGMEPCTIDFLER